MTDSINPIHILLIEDNEGDVVLTLEALGDGKIVNSISIVKDGWEAVQYLEKTGSYLDAQKPDIILMDINLPKMNGYEVLKRIKEQNEIKHIPVIIITSSSSQKDIFNCYHNCAAGFITKPFETAAFLKIIISLENFGISITPLAPIKIL